MNRNSSLFLIALITVTIGCGSKSIDEIVSSAQETATGVVADVESTASDAMASVQQTATDAAEVAQIADLTGKASITLDSPTEFAASFVRMVDVGDGRPVVLQIKSNRDEDEEKFPAFLVQAQVPSNDLNALNGQTVSARFFAQKSAEDAVWFSEEGKNIDVAITVADGQVSAKIDGAMVSNTKTEQASPISGTFECAELK